MSYVGGPGYELYVATDQCVTLYDALVAEGAALGLRDAGYYTIDALRIEAGRRAWGAELSPDETPFEAGLERTVRLDKPGGFIGRDALVAQRAAGVGKRLLMFVFDDPDAFPWGGEPIVMNGERVGELASAAYSARHRVPSPWGMRAGAAPLTDDAVPCAALRDRHRRPATCRVGRI
jgi:4-methylaminobutanoate oxidase (formaldehyde-forming)